MYKSELEDKNEDKILFQRKLLNVQLLYLENDILQI